MDRNNTKERTVATVDDMNYGVFKVKDGDVVSVGEILDRYDVRGGGSSGRKVAPARRADGVCRF